MSLLRKYFRDFCCFINGGKLSMATEPPPSQPDKAPTPKDQQNDQQQQRAPKKRTPLSRLHREF